MQRALSQDMMKILRPLKRESGPSKTARKDRGEAYQLSEEDLRLIAPSERYRRRTAESDIAFLPTAS
jgi:hypothetical protein